MLLLSGCVTTWDGYSPGHKFRVVFVNSENVPLEGVESFCIGSGFNGVARADDLNRSHTTSDSSGLLTMQYSSKSVGGSYVNFGFFKWQQSKPINMVNCTFTLNGNIIYSAGLTELFQSTTIVIK